MFGLLGQKGNGREENGGEGEEEPGRKMVLPMSGKIGELKGREA